MMKGFLKKILLVSFCLFVVSCSSSRVEKKDESNPPKEAIAKPGEPIAPNTCRLVATVISIDPVLKSSNVSSPCSKAPCKAIVRVNAILGYGAAFVKPLAVGDTLLVTFAFSVAPTKEVASSLSQSYPGVKQGTTFVADVIGREGFKDEGASYTIFGYTVR